MRMKNPALKDALEALKKSGKLVGDKAKSEPSNGTGLVTPVAVTRVPISPKKFEFIKRAAVAPSQDRAWNSQRRPAHKKKPIADSSQKKFEAYNAHLSAAYGQNSAGASGTAEQKSWSASFGADAQLMPLLSAPPPQNDVMALANDGSAVQIAPIGAHVDTRELILGLDFGTSCVKVVVQDVSTGHAHAVPFTVGKGISRYLLPTRLWEGEGCYSLLGGANVYRNLKLGLLDEDGAEGALTPTVAFLALVIRHVRGWLFSEHIDIYRKAALVWKVRLGIPTEYFKAEPEAKLVKRFNLLAWSAWICSSANSAIHVESVRESILRARELVSGSSVGQGREDVEVEVIPEIAAQIFGFLKSDQFAGSNARYMVVDIGAGTVDSSLFMASKSKGGRWDFEFYTTVVAQNGAANLHRKRVKWWMEAVERFGQGQGALLQKLRDSRLPTDFQASIPETFTDYIEDAKTRFEGGAMSPDDFFYQKRVVAQVRGKTLYRAKDYLPADQHWTLGATPMFLCGGGARMKFYDRLRDSLLEKTGVSWQTALPQRLVLPRSFRADGVDAADYDRLSVAYGLSCLEVGSIEQAMAEAKAPALELKERPDRDELYAK